MPSDYELSDITVKYRTDSLNNSASNHKTTPEDKMYVSPAKAFILAFLAIAVAVGVGIIVHFAGPAREFECSCTFPTSSSGNGGGSSAAQVDQCKDLASGGNTEICGACPDVATSPPVTCPPTAAPPATTVAPSSGTTTPSTAVSTTVAPPVVDVRLPTALHPLLYTVELQPNMYAPLQPEEFTFTGKVAIKVYCREATRNITLHINKLNITGDISVLQENGVAEMYASTEYDTVRQFIIIHTTTEMLAGSTYIVNIASFIGPLKADLAGLYLSSYTRGNDTIHITTSQMQPTDARKTFPCMDEPAIKSEFKVTLVRKSHMLSISNMPIMQNETRYMATTLMAPIDARKALPCFDEPAFRAAFDITLVRKENKISLSNMPLIGNETRADGWVADHFETTPNMSTYLLAFIICDFEYTQNITTNNITYRAWARPEAINQTPYSLDVGVKILDFFEEFFNVKYPLPKQDMIAIPDFAAGAMENWGLITYRETAMLYEPGVSSEGNKQRVAVVVSHELAHQWFGNLVTPSWWDDLWLNEGFASYVEYMGVDIVHPDWLMFDQFVVEDLQDVFNFDGLISSHPVYVPVAHPDEINEIFDRISYAKGASIIRMMRFFLGDATFQNGLTNYLNNLAYGAAFHDDLWFALGNRSVVEGTPQDVKGIMDTWTLQMNYPVVKVIHTAGSISLSQSRYLQDPNATDPMKFVSPFGYKWHIPFTYTTNVNTNFNVNSTDVKWMGRDAGTVIILDDALPSPGGTNWVIGNPRQYGYYRVNYEEENWNALIEQLKLDHTKIHAINRAQIINDAWNLARSGELDMNIALKTTEYLSAERSYMAWTAANRELGFVGSMLERHPLYGSFSHFMKDKTQPTFDSLTMNNTGATHLESYVRSTISSLACDYGIQGCVDEAKRLFAEWMATPTVNPIDPGLKSTVYCTAVASGGITEWEFALAQYRSANLAAEKSRLLSSLACTTETWILSRFLEMAIDANEIRRQDAVGVIVGISRNTIGRSLAWDFFRGNWDFLLNDFGAGSFGFSNLVGGITSSFNTAFDIDQLRAFVDSKDDLGSGARAFDQALEKTQSNINWMTANVPIIESWLKLQGY